MKRCISVKIISGGSEKLLPFKTHSSADSRQTFTQRKVGQEKYRGKRVKYVSHNNYRKGGRWAVLEKARNENYRDKKPYMIRRQIDASSLCKEDGG